jgi:flavorubredoxin
MQQPFMAKKITEKVYWVGAIDSAIRNFHGYETLRGTTYNAYLILGEKPILIDTVKAPFYDEMMSRIASVIDPATIKYIISNHAEMDHSGSLPRTIQAIKPEKVFASKMGVKALKAHFRFTDEITAINSGDTLELGDAKLTFLETRMLHWPDSMFTFFRNDGVLFSQDGFGMHLAAQELFSADNDREIMRHEACKYFANILLPYSGLVLSLLKKFPSFNLAVKVLAPDHGPVWNNQKDIAWIMGLWQKWAAQKPEKKVVVVYDSMWGSTGKMAQEIAESVAAQGVEVKLMPLSGSHRSDVAMEVLEAGALLVGSPTINQQMFPTVADVMCYLKGLKPKNLIGQVFGSYGWGGESIKLLQKELTEMSVELIDEPAKVQYVPNDEALNSCHELGIKIVENL